MMCFDINLEDNKIGETCSPGVISSGGLGPCIAIGIYDNKRRYGYMMHESNAVFNQELPSFIIDILNKSKKEDLIVYVTGGGINKRATVEENKDTKACRNYVKKELEKIFDKITYKWNNSTDVVELILETDTGKFFVENTEMDY